MSLLLPCPETFPAFPYDPPYSIQVDLMKHLYTAIEERKVTIVESPTGTGKTLSLLCAALTWLSDEKNRSKKGTLDAIGSYDTPDWVTAQVRERAIREIEATELEFEQRLATARKKEVAMRKMANARFKKMRILDSQPPDENGDLDSFLPESKLDTEDNISPVVRALMAKVDGIANRPSVMEEPICTKIYFASRTHSQLTQVIPELQKLKLGMPSFSHTSIHVPRKRSVSDEDMPETTVLTKTVSLGSRKQLCINDDLRRTGMDLDGGCQELLDKKEGHRCPHLPSMDEEGRMLDFRDQILASPKDIEDLAQAGRLANICPYFGSRRAIPQAELVALPYNLLLQKTARESLGIDLTGQIVIIDEAHNLIPSLLSISTVRLPLDTLSLSLYQVCQYVAKFRTRLSAVHMLHLKRLITFMDALRKYLLQWKEGFMKDGSGPLTKSEIMAVTDFLQRVGKGAISLNFLEIEEYLRHSKVARKIARYSELHVKDGPSTSRHQSLPPLYAVESFIVSLTKANDDGRISLLTENGHIEVKYQLLNPAPQFADVVEASRTVILAGGTMSPISDIVSQLFSQVPSERLMSFTCGHVIPPSNLQTIVVSSGPSDTNLCFKLERQRDLALVRELGQVLLNFSRIIPAGMVVFFPSYRFMNAAKKCWDEARITPKLQGRKELFFEPENAHEVETVLQNYAAAATSSHTSQKGALLFAVIGAKLSEGLNFSDDLARAVIIIGLPFPNVASSELQERMKYVNQLQERKQTWKAEKRAGTELYENICMNSVNQSIGRAIRHQGDWASLILLDERYKSAAIRQKLPHWIGKTIEMPGSFGQAVKQLAAFYQMKR